MVVRSGSGAQFAVAPTDLGTYFAMLNNGRQYPAHVLETCKRHLREGDVMYDIGANIGYITVEIAHHFSGRVEVVAFEPQPELANAIAVSAALNGVSSVTVFDTLLGEGEGTADLFLVGNSAHASTKARALGAKRVERPVTTLDALLQRQSLRPPTLMKIDVEGSELSVLRGAQRTLREHQPYLLFEADSNMSRFGYSKAELFELIRSAYDYTFYDVESDAHGHLARIRRVEGAAVSSRDDILAVPSNKLVRSGA
jgi:FkbM family methyltransferase